MGKVKEELFTELREKLKEVKELVEKIDREILTDDEDSFMRIFRAGTEYGIDYMEKMIGKGDAE